MRNPTPDRLPDPERVAEGNIGFDSLGPTEYLDYLDDELRSARKNLKDETENG